jgi:hypothetical protein
MSKPQDDQAVLGSPSVPADLSSATLSHAALSGGPCPPVPACVPAPPRFCNGIPVDQGGCKPS